uniref:Cyclin n=1 Tax=Hemiselmis tepida TaxID=464990 RepID=A0A7S0VY75_9CRYP|mmetsp:Transcript_29401/g.74574  ORF Transcript_29401/g.74574 Transcript_29401/m.74574 type:complete len:353 (+) Transcript_29401:282-1340(+)|eukprot:CAMPEP_0174928520 /NCGR_PEP_ID=MMETSP1355-20121228/24019_1 /TAXON_ID=464990 /ORGANISM="Hemiselmis tepida, Strain CCMP443" /LENGTH=352 /DNA_ID=CAMNT_0016174681 /DNA_START=247 /DNA_END=1305 /DNA_ORIENTATION=+
MTGTELELEGGQPVAPSHTTAEGAHGQTYSEFVRLLKQDADSTKALVPAVISLLEERIEHNDALVLTPGSKFMMNITVKDYMKRIEKYSGASPCCYAIGLIFLERLKSSQRKRGVAQDRPLLTSATYQRLVVTAIMVAAKFLDDYYHSNKHWALIAGLPTKELNNLEVDFLDQLGYRLHIQREEYDWFAQELYERAERAMVSNKFSELNLVSDDALSMMSTPPTSSMSIGPDSHQEHAQSKAYAIHTKPPAAASDTANYFNVPSQEKGELAADTPPLQHQEPSRGRQWALPSNAAQNPVARHTDAPARQAPAVTTRVQVTVHQPYAAQWPQLHAPAPVYMGGYGMPMVQWNR